MGERAVTRPQSGSNRWFIVSSGPLISSQSDVRFVLFAKIVQRGPTRDLEACLVGGAPKERTLAGASFSMEWRLCEDGRLSVCDLAAAAAAETGRNLGGAGDDKVVDEHAKNQRHQLETRAVSTRY